MPVPSTYGDPLARWGKILNDVLIADAPKTKVAAHLAQSKALHDRVKNNVHAIQHGMDGNPLSLEQVFSLPTMHAIATPYTMVRIFRLLTPLIETVGKLGHQGFYGSPRASDPHVLLFSEFFVYYCGSNAEIRRKKRWP